MQPGCVSPTFFLMRDPKTRGARALYFRDILVGCPYGDGHWQSVPFLLILCLD